jgi:hypothetical protein
VQTTVSTASGICHTVIAICRYRGRVGTGLSLLWVAYATHSKLKTKQLKTTQNKTTQTQNKTTLHNVKTHIRNGGIT